jgi:hypothetical protein
MSPSLAAAALLLLLAAAFQPRVAHAQIGQT